MPIPRDLIVID